MSKKPMTKREVKNLVKNQEISEKKTGAWTQALVTMIFVLIPAIVMWVFLSKDFNAKPILTTEELWGVAIGFVGYTLLITLFLIWIELIWIDTMNFTLPIAIVLMSILLSQNIVIWGRALIVIGLIFTALPVNMFTIRYIEYKISKNKEPKKYV